MQILHNSMLNWNFILDSSSMQNFQEKKIVYRTVFKSSKLTVFDKIAWTLVLV
jgi:hypothetical protein